MGAQAIIDRFLQLIDSPSSYSGEGGKAVLVKSAEDGLEFGSSTGVSAGEHVTQSAQLDLTASYQVVPGLTKTFTPPVCKAVVIAQVQYQLSPFGTDRDAVLEIYVDGVAQNVGITNKIKNTYSNHYHAMVILAVMSLTAVEHTIDARGKVLISGNSPKFLTPHGHMGIVLIADTAL